MLKNLDDFNLYKVEHLTGYVNKEDKTYYDYEFLRPTEEQQSNFQFLYRGFDNFAGKAGITDHAKVEKYEYHLQFDCYGELERSTFRVVFNDNGRIKDFDRDNVSYLEKMLKDRIEKDNETVAKIDLYRNYKGALNYFEKDAPSMDMFFDRLEKEGKDVLIDELYEMKRPNDTVYIPVVKQMAEKFREYDRELKNPEELTKKEKDLLEYLTVDYDEDKAYDKVLDIVDIAKGSEEHLSSPWDNSTPYSPDYLDYGDKEIKEYEKIMAKEIRDNMPIVCNNNLTKFVKNASDKDLCEACGYKFREDRLYQQYEDRCYEEDRCR